jgi:hypothetical protein
MENGIFQQGMWIECGQVIKNLSTGGKYLRNRIKPNIQSETGESAKIWGVKSPVHSIHSPYDYDEILFYLIKVLELVS